MWRESSLLCDRAVRIMKSKTYVFSDSVLCLGGISPEPLNSLERRNQMVFGKHYLKELDRIDGEPMEFEWTISQDHCIGNSWRDSNDDGRFTVWTRGISRKDHLDVHVTRHSMGNSRKWGQSCSELYECCSIRQKVSVRMLVISGTWLWKSGVELSSTIQMVFGTELLRWCWSISLKAGILDFNPPAFLGRGEIKKQRERKEVHSPQRKWRNRWINFSHCFFLWISSVSTEQWQTCVMNWPQTQENKPKVRSGDLWWYRPNFPMPTPSLRLTYPHRWTCCENTNRNSQNFLMIRNCPNYALTLVSWRKLGKDNSFLHLIKKYLVKWKRCVESVQYLKVKKHPEWEGGFSETRKSARSWMWRSVFIRDVRVIESLFHHKTVSWVRIVNGINKYVTETSKEILVESVELVRTGEPVAKAKPCGIVSCFCSLKENEKTSIQHHSMSVKIRDQITATWRINSSRKRWRNIFLRPDWKVQGKIRWHFGMDSLCLGNFPWPNFLERRSNLVDPLLQDNVLLLDDFPKYIYHTRNAKEMHSIIKSGLILGGRSLEKDRQSVFFTAVNPKYTRKDLEEV